MPTNKIYCSRRKWKPAHWGSAGMEESQNVKLKRRMEQVIEDQIRLIERERDTIFFFNIEMSSGFHVIMQLVDFE